MFDLTDRYDIKVSYSDLLAGILALVFFTRVAGIFDLPQILVFIHFPVVATVFFLCLAGKKSLECQRLSKAIFLFSGFIIMSGIVNRTGVLNIVLEIMIVTEPLMLLYLLCVSVWGRHQEKKIRLILYAIIVFNLVLSYYQFLKTGETGDGIQGLFLNMGAGAHICGAIALLSGLYLYNEMRGKNRMTGYLILFLNFLVVLLSDSKQVIAVYVVASACVLATRVRQWFTVIKYLALMVLGLALLLYIGTTFFPSLLIWLNAEKVIKGLSLKFAVFHVMKDHYEWWGNWFVGLGPGHSVGRLGWLIPKYYGWLKPFGITKTTIFDSVWYVQQSNYISNSKTGSSMFSLIFSWAGFFGDLGFFGIAGYVYLWFVVFRNFCVGSFSKLLLFSVIIFGFVFTWLEEPPFMCFVVSLLGLLWQEKQIRNRDDEVASHP
jgi:hypothetical protein